MEYFWGKFDLDMEEFLTGGPLAQERRIKLIRIKMTTGRTFRWLNIFFLLSSFGSNRIGLKSPNFLFS
jgi:hypothetical protein